MGYHDSFAAQLSNSLTTSLYFQLTSYLEISGLTLVTYYFNFFSEIRMKELAESIYIKDQLEIYGSNHKTENITTHFKE